MEKLPLPKSLKKISQGKSQATFVVEPLYPGYGITVGNALRRVLLSSLSGAAITNVSIEGATHEFSTMPYVKEDIVDIVLNLKRVRLKMHEDGPVTIKLAASGVKTVTAKDIETTSDIEVINKDQVIATLTDKAAKIEMEITVEKGRGYVPVEQREKPKNPIGTIAIDGIFSPIKNVNFSTENVRVGQMTNYDRLILDITSDGSIDPEEALREAAKIMVDHFSFISEQDASKDEDTAEAEKEEVDETAVDEDAAEDKPKRKSTKKKTEEE